MLPQAYPEEYTKPIREELTQNNVQELITEQDVKKWFSQDEKHVLLVNSICGCAAGNARPGLYEAIAKGVPANKTATVFAGVHRQATATARNFLLPQPPSSPSIFVLQGEQVLHAIPRANIERRGAQEIAQEILAAWND